MNVHRSWFRLGLTCLVIVSSCFETSAQAQTFPGGPVKFITSLSAGIGTEPAMRILADKLGQMWGQQTVVINQPGAGGVIAARAAAAATPNGQTLFMAVASTFTVLPVTEPNLAASLNDFVPIGFVGEVPMGIAVSPNLTVNSLPELIALSQKQPGGLDTAVEFRGGVPHLTTELLRSRTAANLNPVFYLAGGVAMGDVIAGRVPVMIQGVSSPIAAGQLKLLAIASATRLQSHPDVPTVAETVPGFTASGWFVLVAPPGTPASIAQKISDDLRVALAAPDVKEKFAALSVSTRPLSPPQLQDFIHSEQQLWMPIVKRLGLVTQ